MRKIAVFTGTRAEYGLLRPVLRRLENSSTCILQLIVSGTHLSTAHGYTIDEITTDGFSPAATVHLTLTKTSPEAIALGLGGMVAELGNALARLQPDILVLLGDRYECLGAALTASLFNLPIAHISGGDITEGAVDDSYRHAISKLSHLHFTSCEEYRQRVIQLGEQAEKVFNFGDLGVENVLALPLLSGKEIRQYLGVSDRSYFLCTFHPETLGVGSSSEKLHVLLEALDTFSEYDVVFTGANADAEGDAINTLLKARADQAEHFHFFMSLGLLRYLSAAKYAACVVGNSSSGILEIPSLGVPVVNIGDRQRGRLCSQGILHCPLEARSVRQALSQALTPEQKKFILSAPNPYGKTGASQAIAEILQSYPLTGILKKKFFDLPR